MKQHIFTLLVLLSGISACSQIDTLPINKAFARIDGEWDGFFEFAIDDADRTASMPAKCVSTWDGKLWKYDVKYDEGEGEMSAGKGQAVASIDGKTIEYNGLIWTVSEVNNRGDSTSIVLEITDKEKRKTVSTRHVIFITSTSFFITEYRKEEGQANYTFSNKHLFRRKK